MYDYFRGSLIEAHSGHWIVDVQGLGYKIFVPNRYSVPVYESEVKLFTAFVIRENSQALYGFYTRPERELFELLIGLTGVGPKTGIGIISYFSVQELNRAIYENNIAALTTIPGIGKKTAERLIVELKDKLLAFSNIEVASMPSKDFSQYGLDALHALINLGYNQQSSQLAVKKALEDLSENAELPQIITAALKNVRSKKS